MLLEFQNNNLSLTVAKTNTFSKCTLTVRKGLGITLEPVLRLLVAVLWLNTGPISRTVVPICHSTLENRDHEHGYYLTRISPVCPGHWTHGRETLQCHISLIVNEMWVKLKQANNSTTVWQLNCVCVSSQPNSPAERVSEFQLADATSMKRRGGEPLPSGPYKTCETISSSPQRNSLIEIIFFKPQKKKKKNRKQGSNTFSGQSLNTIRKKRLISCHCIMSTVNKT